MSQPIALRITTAGVVYAYGNKNDALAAAGATDHVYEIVNCLGQQVVSLSGGVLTEAAHVGANHVKRLK